MKDGRLANQLETIRHQQQNTVDEMQPICTLSDMGPNKARLALNESNLGIFKISKCI